MSLAPINTDARSLVDVYARSTGTWDALGLIVGFGLGISALLPVILTERAGSLTASAHHLLLVGCCAAAGITFPVLVLRHVRLRAGIRIANIVSQGKDKPLGAVAEQALASPSEIGAPGAQLVRALVSTGRVGVTIRNCPPKLAKPIRPISVRFEARPLDQGDPSFASLEGALNLGINDERTDGWRKATGTSQESYALRVKRNIIALGGKSATIAVLVLMAGLALSQWLTSGTILLPILIAVVAIVLVSNRKAPGTGSAQWLVVPGGIIVRTAPWRTRRWNVHVFDRHTSVLVVQAVRGDQWTLSVGDPECQYRASATTQECNLLLRAWLSPLNPPPIERLSDLR